MSTYVRTFSPGTVMVMQSYNLKIYKCYKVTPLNSYLPTVPQQSLIVLRPTNAPHHCMRRECISKSAGRNESVGNIPAKSPYFDMCRKRVGVPSVMLACLFLVWHHVTIVILRKLAKRKKCKPSENCACAVPLKLMGWAISSLLVVSR